MRKLLFGSVVAGSNNTLTRAQPTVNTKLPQNGIFATLSADVLKVLATHGEYNRASQGCRLIQQGQAQHEFFFVLSGELQVFYCTTDKNHFLATIRAGESVGEANLFVPRNATASVFASQDCFLWKMNKSQLLNFINNYQEAGMEIVCQVVNMLSIRIEKLNEKTSNLLNTIQ